MVVGGTLSGDMGYIGLLLQSSPFSKDVFESVLFNGLFMSFDRRNGSSHLETGDRMKMCVVYHSSAFST